ncbi:hypothetical protein [Acinetobacter sp. CFCC 10889]|uniref:hypothetical protein n=1 Tax=Acinetobacter sp. CFCC 10889 TaxID=1775557 RepID=UPI000DD0719B|nr:hypothetical protein [Acinetobacter sp. CFCC 10889]
MYEYQSIKSYWFSFLSQTYFKESTFKEINECFYFVFPQFKEKSLYRKHYRAFREAQKSGFVTACTEKSPYMYTSDIFLENQS